MCVCVCVCAKERVSANKTVFLIADLWSDISTKYLKEMHARLEERVHRYISLPIICLSSYPGIMFGSCQKEIILFIEW